MARLPILEYPDKRLRLVAADVTVFDETLDRLVDDLVETLRSTSGIGLCAPQVGDLRRVLVLDLSGGQLPAQVYVNPEIVSQSTPGLVEESCLSVPGVVGNVVRSTVVRVRAQDRAGETFERDLEAMNAVALLHEMDHLSGTLFIDRLGWLARLRCRRTLRSRVAAQATA